MRKLAVFLAEKRPDVAAVCEIGPGDALSLATRFDMQWAYRGRQALFWRAKFSAGGVEGEYLPAPPPRALARRGFVRVDGSFAGVPCTLAATQFSNDRRSRISELRFARTQLRFAHRTAIVFAHLLERRIAFADLGFADATPNDGDERVYTRGLERVELNVAVATV